MKYEAVFQLIIFIILGLMMALLFAIRDLILKIWFFFRTAFKLKMFKLSIHFSFFALHLLIFFWNWLIYLSVCSVFSSFKQEFSFNLMSRFLSLYTQLDEQPTDDSFAVVFFSTKFILISLSRLLYLLRYSSRWLELRVFIIG